MLGAGGPSQEKAGGQAEKADQMDERKTAAGLLFARLWENLLIGSRVWSDDRGAINDPDAQAAPEVFAGDGPFRLTCDGTVNLFQRFDRQLTAGGAIGTVLVRRRFSAQ